MESSVTFGDNNAGFQAGIIKGPVNTQFHQQLPPERSETPPKPSAFISFSRDLDFVERGAILDQIHQKCAVPGSRTALVGLGGVGKSQLAIEYTYRTRERFPETWIFWIHASNLARLEQSYWDIANYLKIPGRRNPTADIFGLVHDWLRDERKGKWVVILDNVDDAGFLLEARSIGQIGGSKGRGDSRPLVTSLPQCQNGSILVTTRSKSAALELVEEHNIISIKQMNEEDALALLEKKLGKQDDNDSIAELATSLEFMPLAIVQAAAYISQRAPRCSVRKYLQDFQGSDSKRASLLDFEGGKLRRDWEAKNSVITTWQISFDHISQIRASAAELLSLMSFFDRQGIPETLLRNRREQEEPQQDTKKKVNDREISENNDESNAEDDEFEKDILILRDYSFISTTMSGTSFEMHGLVQLATRRWLEAHGLQERWKRQFIRNLSAEFPTGDYENWTTCRALFPHAKSAVSHEPKEQESLKTWASVLYNAATYAWKIGNWTEGEDMSTRSMKVRKKVFGRDHEATLRSMEMLGWIYLLQGRMDLSEELLVQVMDTHNRELGANHPSTLQSITNVTSIYLDQGRWKEAEELEVHMIEKKETVLGKEHPATLSSINNLALSYEKQGHWEKAEDLYMKVIETKKRVLSENHPETLFSRANLAELCRIQGRWKEAENSLLQVIEMETKMLDGEHPNTLISMNNLASIYRNQGRWIEAENLQVRMGQIKQKVLGEEHPSTLITISNLASIYLDQGRKTEAEELNLQVMKIKKRVLGDEHPETLISMGNVASVYQKQERLIEAEELELQVMEVRKRVLGEEHPDTL